MRYFERETGTKVNNSMIVFFFFDFQVKLVLAAKLMFLGDPDPNPREILRVSATAIWVNYLGAKMSQIMAFWKKKENG